MYSTFSLRAGRAFNLNVYDKPTRAQRAQTENVAHEDHGSFARFQCYTKPPELLQRAVQEGCVHARDDKDTPQTKLRHTENRSCPPNERHGNHRLHPRRRPRPSGALRGLGARRSRERHRFALHDCARKIGCDRRRCPPPRPFPLRSEAS
jgi:hypothetical protein